MFEDLSVRGIAETAQSYFQVIAVGIVILLAGFGLGVLVKKVLHKFLTEVGLNKIMSSVGITANVEKWASLIASYVIYLFTIVFFLEHFGIKSIVLWLFAGGVLMLLILSFLVGLKDVIPNFIGWLVIQKHGKIKEGRTINVKEISGRVERVGFLETEIKTDRDDVLYVPNSLFLKNKFRMT